MFPHEFLPYNKHRCWILLGVSLLCFLRVPIDIGEAVAKFEISGTLGGIINPSCDQYYCIVPQLDN
jgi:hypothetical protein